MAAGALPLLCQVDGLTGGLALLHAVFSGQLAHPLPVAAAGVLVHVGIVARGVLIQHPLHPAGPLQKGAPLRPGQGPQGSKDGPHLLGGHPVLFEGAHIATQPSQPLHQRPGQGGDEQGQLPLRQRAHRLEALQVEGQPLLVQIGGGPQGAPGAPLEECAALPAPPEGLSAFKRLPGLLPLPDGQVVVVQQPLHRPGDSGLAGAP